MHLERPQPALRYRKYSGNAMDFFNFWLQKETSRFFIGIFFSPNCAEQLGRETVCCFENLIIFSTVLVCGNVGHVADHLLFVHEISIHHSRGIHAGTKQELKYSGNFNIYKQEKAQVGALCKFESILRRRRWCFEKNDCFPRKFTVKKRGF